MIVIGEAEYGSSRIKSKRERSIVTTRERQLLFAMAAILPCDFAVAIRYGGLLNLLDSGGLRIPTNDVWIAATAFANDCTVVTSDKHFGRIPNLNLVDWAI